MGKFVIGAATAALWFILSHAANAEGVARSSALGQSQVETSTVGPALWR
jgi:hypothetical protein